MRLYSAERTLGWMLVLKTKREGGPFVVSWGLPQDVALEPREQARGADNAMRILATHLEKNAPGVHAECVRRGWLSPPSCHATPKGNE